MLPTRACSRVSAYTDDGETIDCTKMGMYGRSIPGQMKNIELLDSTASFVLLVEKDSTFGLVDCDPYVGQCTIGYARMGFITKYHA